VNLYEFATTTDASGEQLAICRFSIADHADPAKRSEWLDAQIAIDLPTVRNGALLRAEVLRKASGELRRLADRFEQIGRDPQSAPPNPARS
jgi:hypothetical protein